MAKKEKKILVVEDDAFLSNILESKLKKEGHDVQLAHDGVEALEALKTFVPNLIILDLIMPRKDGFAVLEELSQDEDLKKIPVLTLTNLGHESDKKRVNEYSAVVDYIVKADIPIQQVVEKVEGLL